MTLDYTNLLPPSALADPTGAAAGLPGAALLRINFVPGLRQRLNWRGMRECPRFPDSLTARVAGRQSSATFSAGGKRPGRGAPV